MLSQSGDDCHAMTTPKSRQRRLFLLINFRRTSVHVRCVCVCVFASVRVYPTWTWTGYPLSFECFKNRLYAVRGWAYNSC